MDQAEKNDAEVGGKPPPKCQLTEVLVEGQECIGYSGLVLSDPGNLEPGISKGDDSRTREILVGQEPHAGSSG